MNNQGWECGKCGRVNAPWMPHCHCHEVKTSTTYGTAASTTTPFGSPVDLRICGLCGTQFKFGEMHACKCMQSGSLT